MADELENDDAGMVQGGAMGTADGGAASGAGDAAGSSAANADAEGSAGVEGDAPKPPGNSPPAPTAAELWAKLPEAEQRQFAQKFANATMAAARRAQRKVEQNQRAQGEWESKYKALEPVKTEYDAFKDLWSKDPASAIRKMGDADVRALLDRIANSKQLDTTPKPDDRIAELEKRLKERDERDKASFSEAARTVARKNVFDALAKDERFDITANTERGREEVWDAVEEYLRIHGSCPDDQIFKMAQAIETELANDLGAARRWKGQSAAPAAKSASAAGSAASSSANGGRAIENNGGSDPVRRAARLEDEDAERIRVLKELGFIAGSGA